MGSCRALGRHWIARSTTRCISIKTLNYRTKARATYEVLQAYSRVEQICQDHPLRGCIGCGLQELVCIVAGCGTNEACSSELVNTHSDLVYVKTLGVSASGLVVELEKLYQSSHEGSQEIQADLEPTSKDGASLRALQLRRTLWWSCSNRSSIPNRLVGVGRLC